VNNQGQDSIAIGFQAGGAGANSIGIGRSAACPVNNTINLNASGSAIPTITQAGFFVTPIRDLDTNLTGKVLCYDTTTKEIGLRNAESSYVGLVNFATAKSTNAVFGPTANYAANNTINVGEPVGQDATYTAGLRVRSFVLGDVFVGIATTSTSAAGQQVTVALKGAYCVVRRKTNQQASFSLTSANNGSLVTSKWVRFSDSGGLSGNYSASENYNVVFDAGSQSGSDWTITANDWTMESGYDRLGVQYSASATGPWGNPIISGLWTSTTITAPWANSFSSTTQGNIWTATPSALYPSGGHPYSHAINVARFIRFTFFSDGSNQQPGWDITLLSNKYKAVGSPLYFDQNNPGFVTDNPTADTNQAFATIAATDDAGDTIYARVL
jgi:hypothetical protein